MEPEKDPNNGRRVEKIINQLNLLSVDLFEEGTLSNKLQRITEGVVAIFHADLARVWLSHPGDLCGDGCVHATTDGMPKACREHKECLHLIASSGRYSRTNGHHRRIPYDHCSIGILAAGDDARFLTNDLSSHALLHDKEWAENLQLTAFAGYRLLSNKKRPIGVLGCFSLHVITPDQDALLESLSIMTAQVVQIEADLEAMRESEIKYRDLFENISDFLYTHDLEGNFKEANLAIKTAFDFNEADMKHLNIKDMMPERYQKDFDGYMRDILQNGKSDGVISLVAKDGMERIVEYKNSLMHGPEGPIGVRGSARDITDSIRNKQELIKSEERFQQVAENAREWVWEMDISGLYTYANSAVEKILGYTPAEIEAIKYFYDFFLPEEREDFKQFAFRSFKQKEKFRDRIYRNLHKNGEIVWLSSSGVPILNDHGKLTGYRGVTADITKQKKTEAELMHLSYFDGLTGIANRRYFEDIAGREWRRAAREESPISLMMVDIDFFKNYNDMYGHLAGDECLQKVAKTLKEHLKRPGDMVARYGGEEFVILLPDTDAKNATTLAEGLRRRIEKLGIEHAESFVSDVVTISLGVACVLPNENISLSVLISNADRALYRAKKAGRNRVGTVDLMTPATQSK